MGSAISSRSQFPSYNRLPPPDWSIAGVWTALTCQFMGLTDDSTAPVSFLDLGSGVGKMLGQQSCWGDLLSHLGRCHVMVWDLGGFGNLGGCGSEAKKSWA